MPLALPPSAYEYIQNHLKVEGQFRSRLERRLDRDFDASQDDNRSSLIQRARLSIRFLGDSNWTLGSQIQYTRTDVIASTKQSKDQVGELLQLFAQHQFRAGKLTIGRQRISVGSERLMGSPDWVTRARTFDGIRVQTKNLDIFLTQVTNIDSQRPRLLGAHWQKGIHQTTLVLKNEDKTRTDTGTLHHAVKRTAGDLTLDFEGAGQFGRTLDRSVQSWAFLLRATRLIGKSSRIYGEWTMASGGRADSDTFRTFDPLYPSNHKLHGLLEMQGWRNLNQVVLAYGTKPRSGLELRFRFMRNWLQDSRDAWYGPNGSPNKHGSVAFIDPSGQSGRDLGSEFNLEAIWAPSSRQTIAMVFGGYQPGRFIKLQTGRARTQIYGYLQVEFKL